MKDIDVSEIVGFSQVAESALGAEWTWHYTWMGSTFEFNVNGAVSPSTDTGWSDGARKQRKRLQGLVSFTLGLEGLG